MDLNPEELFKPRRIAERARIEKIREEEELSKINSEIEEFELNFPELDNEFKEAHFLAKSLKYSVGLLFFLLKENDKIILYSNPYHLTDDEKIFKYYLIKYVDELKQKGLEFICVVGTSKFNSRKDKDKVLEKIGEDIHYLFKK